MNRYLLRITSVVVVPALLADPVAASGFSQLRRSPAQPLRIPARYGRITDAYSVRPESCVLSRESNTATLARDAGPKTQDPRLVVLIQDLHGHPGAQRNIAEILEHIAGHLYSSPLEGEGPPMNSLPLTWAGPVRGGRGRVRGTSRSPSPSSSPVKGEELQSRHLTVFVEGASGPFDLSLLTRIPDRRIRKTIADYLLDSARLSGPEYAAVLTTRSGLRAGGSASYTAGSARSPEPRASLELLGVDDPDLYAANLQAFKDTYAYYQALPSKRHYPAFGEARPYGRPTFQDFLISPLLPESQRPLIIPKPLERYYRLARARDPKFVENLLIHSPECCVLSAESRQSVHPLKKGDPATKPLLRTQHSGLSTVVLVVGGFHTAGITAELKQRGIPYVVVTPRVDRLGHEALYVKRLLQCDFVPGTKNAQVASFKQVERTNLVALLNCSKCLAQWESSLHSCLRRTVSLCQLCQDSIDRVGELQNSSQHDGLAVRPALALASLGTAAYLLLTHLVPNWADALALQQANSFYLILAGIFSVLSHALLWSAMNWLARSRERGALQKQSEEPEEAHQARQRLKDIARWIGTPDGRGQVISRPPNEGTEIKTNTFEADGRLGTRQVRLVKLLGSGLAGVVYLVEDVNTVSARKVGVRAVDVPFFLSSFVIRIARFRPLFAEFPALPDDIFLIW